MDLGTKNLNDLISKDDNASNTAAKRILDNCDVESFEKLCEKSEFLFDYIKEKILKNLVCAADKDNFLNTFKFIKIYNIDFEDFIIKVWLKFANDDLTDKILEIFEDGTAEEKAYAASYFYYINDPLALEDLKKNAFSDYEPLAQNCARTLSKFNDREIFNQSIEIIEDSTVDDFEKYKYVNFLISYGDKQVFNNLYNYLENSFAKGFIASSILYLKGFYEILEDNELDKALRIFDAILTSYPEEISLDTVIDFEIFNFLSFLVQKINIEKTQKSENSYIKRLILKAKYKFNLISREDIYTFDLAKNIKKEINNISAFLNTIKTNLFEGLEKELESSSKDRVFEALDVILNFGKVEFSNDIKETIEKTQYEDVISEGIKVLKSFNRLDLIQKDETIAKLKNENIKAIILSTFS